MEIKTTMQIYVPLSEFIEANKLAIAEEVASVTLSRQITSYLKYDSKQLAVLFLPTVEMLARYVLIPNPKGL